MVGGSFACFSTPDAGELAAILVGFAHGCAPPHRWGVKGKEKATQMGGFESIGKISPSA